MDRRLLQRLISSVVFCGLAIFPACATIRVTELPPSQATPKLRIYVQAFTGPGNWGDSPHEVFVKDQIRLVEQHFAASGIYELVSSKDVHMVLGDQSPTLEQLKENEWALARKIGRALHADYVIVIDRVWQQDRSGEWHVVIDNLMINVKSGNGFASHRSLGQTIKLAFAQAKKAMWSIYRDIFNSAKTDCLVTAID